MLTEDGGSLAHGMETYQQSQAPYYVTEDVRPPVKSINEDTIVPIYEHLPMRERIPNWTLIKVLFIVVTAMQKRAQMLDTWPCN